MVNLAEKHEEDSSAQLADAEISRILTALQKAEFKRSESVNARPDQTFKPRSLMEIAETANQQDEATKAAEITAEIAVNKGAHKTGESRDETVDEMATGSGDTLTEDKAPEPTGDNQSSGRQSTDVVDYASKDAGLEMQPTESDDSDPQDLPVIGVGEGADAGFDHCTDNGVGPGSPTSPFETAQAAYDRGYGDGVTAGREAAEAELRATIEAEFEAKFADKIKAFETALIGLAKPRTVDTSALSKSLQAAVIRLAAARTGAAIDEMPELMIARIESLADAAGKHVATGHVFMHPDDCAVIAPIMEKCQDQFTIEPDPNLHRGDICVRFDGMEISDVADLRVDWQISQSMQRKNSVEFETAQTKISDVELETPTVNNLSLDSQEASIQSSINSPSLQDGANGEPMVDDNANNEDVSPSEAIGLMPLTTTGGDDSASDGGTGDNADASSSDPIGLMPLTTTGGADSASDGGTGDNADASSSETIGLMPLTTTGGDDSASDGGTGDKEDTSPSEAIGLMPLTSKSFDE